MVENKNKITTSFKRIPTRQLANTDLAPALLEEDTLIKLELFLSFQDYGAPYGLVSFGIDIQYPPFILDQYCSSCTLDRVRRNV